MREANTSCGNLQPPHFWSALSTTAQMASQDASSHENDMYYNMTCGTTSSRMEAVLLTTSTCTHSLAVSLSLSLSLSLLGIHMFLNER